MRSFSLQPFLSFQDDLLYADPAIFRGVLSIKKAPFAAPFLMAFNSFSCSSQGRPSRPSSTDSVGSSTTRFSALVFYKPWGCRFCMLMVL